MDLSVLHSVNAPDKDYKWKDKLNSLTDYLNCYFLEWSGWYSQDIQQRFLGHYLLFQLFKVDHPIRGTIPLSSLYILSYRSIHHFKHFICRIIGVLFYLFTLGERYLAVEVEAFNHLLLFERPDIIITFLESADQNFEDALQRAVKSIANGDFFKKVDRPSVFLFQKHEYLQHYENNNHYFNEYHSVSTSKSFKGKEKGVFSKKQLLILFDLLAEGKALEKIDYSKPNSFAQISIFLAAISGKSKESIVEQMKEVKLKGLYYYSSHGEFRQLIVILTNISTIAKESGFRTVATKADKKIKEIEFLNARS